MRTVNYPLGASDSTPDALWDTIVIPEKEFDVSISQTISRSTSIMTTDYVPKVDEEDGSIYADTSDTDWKRAYKNSSYTPLEIISACKKIAQFNRDNGILHIDGIHLKTLIENCEGWVEDDYEVMEE